MTVWLPDADVELSDWLVTTANRLLFSRPAAFSYLPTPCLVNSRNLA